MIALAPLPFEVWAQANGYNIAPAVSPIPTRVYADRQTQAAIDVWNAGVAHTARMVTESTLETEALRDKFQELACSK
jgi:hypothetical protein